MGQFLHNAPSEKEKSCSRRYLFCVFYVYSDLEIQRSVKIHRFRRDDSE